LEWRFILLNTLHTRGRPIRKHTWHWCRKLEIKSSDKYFRKRGKNEHLEMLWLIGWKINMEYRKHCSGKEDIAPPYLTLALHGDQLSASCPVHFIPRETALCTYWIGGQVDPREPGCYWEDKNLLSWQELNPDFVRPAYGLVGILTGLCWL
jgi:hypothetical protein